MGLSYDRLYDLTPRSFTNAFRGFNTLRTEEDRRSWEQTRVIAHISASPHLKNKIKPTEFLPLPWDNELKDKNKKPLPSPEEIEKIIKSYDKEKFEDI